MKYPNSIQQLEIDLSEAPNTAMTTMAKRMIEGAKQFDLKKIKNLGVNFKMKGVERNYEDPVSCTTEEVALAAWADPLDGYPIEKGGKWNKGRRATNTGVEYNAFGHVGRIDKRYLASHFEEHGNEGGSFPINPYMNTGIIGRGCLGSYGPNHAVDNGALVLKADENGTPTLYALGILRKYDDCAPAFAGGFAKYERNDDGGYDFNRDSIVQWQLEEFFEETISGSIDLMPKYRDRLPFELAMEVQNMVMSVRNPRFTKKLLTEDRIKILQAAIEAHLKFQQVQDQDPEFLNRLREVIAAGHECFAGPVLNDNRNTNTSWIETRLSWFMMDEETWAHIKGDDPMFDYQFSAGDDASDVVYHRLDKDLIQNAFASHGPMFAFMAASFVLDAQKGGVELDPAIMVQMEDIVDFLCGPKVEIKTELQF